MLPDRFKERILQQLGEKEGLCLCEALDTPSPVSVRLNPRKVEVDALLASCEEKRERLGELQIEKRVGWCAWGAYLSQRPSFTLDPNFHAGAYYVQEASSQFVGHLLEKESVEGKRILDMCAAPGGKTTLYSTLVGEKGLVVANEIDRRRAKILVDNVKKWGMGNTVVTSTDSAHYTCLGEWFDVVAVDAPCSGEGMFRKDETAREEWSEGNVRLCAERQDEILKNAWQVLRPGGVLIYSTCTFNHEEDEGSLERMLTWAEEEVERMETIPIDEEWGIVVGEVGAFQTFHFYPHRACGEGFFAAVARKKVSVHGSSRQAKATRSLIAPADKTATKELERWLKEPESVKFIQISDNFYAWTKEQSEAMKVLSDRLPVIYSGVEMGQIFKGKLKPDAGLAFYVGLSLEAVPKVDVSLEEALKYLRRQEIEVAPLSEGMNLLTFSGRALGFAKRIGRRVNNLYPDSLRILKQ